MKLWKAIMAVTLATIMVTISVAGCGKKEKSSKENSKVIQISYWNSGLGTDWLDAMIEGFEKKYPEYNVTYTESASTSAVIATFGNEDVDENDIYMALEQYNKGFEYAEPLNDVLDSTVDGESKTIREKFIPAYLELEEHEDGTIQSLTYGGGVTSFVYNKKFFEESGIKQLPRTTKELEKVCDTLLSNGYTPFCHFQTSGYWEFMNDAWFLQYDGYDYYMNNFYRCTDEEGNSPSKEVFLNKDGRYEAMKACEQLVTTDYVLAGSNSNDHITMQTEFIMGKAAMMLNGSWMANEMESVGSVDDFSVMKTPVISSITNKLTTVKTEQDLRTLITAIDAVTDGEVEISTYQDGENYNIDGLNVSAKDWEYVRKARNTTASNFSGEVMFIPKYSDAKEGAKEFMRYMFSDEGYRIYTDTLHTTLPIELSEGELDTSGWNAFEKAMSDLSNKTEQVATTYIVSKHPIFYSGGASAYAGYSFVNLFCSSNAGDRIDAKEAWEKVIGIVNGQYENSWLANIGK